MSLNHKESIQGQSLWQKSLNKLRAIFYRSPIYMLTLRKNPQIEIGSLPDGLKRVHLDNKKALIEGKIPFAGRYYKCADHPWSTAQDDLAWQGWVHGFHWLADLCQSDDEAAIKVARRYVQSWMDLHGVWTPLAWRADVIGARMIHWMVNAQSLCEKSDVEFQKAFYSSLSGQAAHLLRARFRDLSGFALLSALRGQLYCALFIKGCDKKIPRILERFAAEMDKQILADGGHISRSPQTLFEVLQMALEVVDVLGQRQVECPDSFRLNIDRIAPMIRTLRHADGGFALFHGAQEGVREQIDEVLDRTGNIGQALSDARHSGYQRIEAGRSVLLMDVAGPPDVSANPFGHAAPLSLELSHGEERVLVNCGSVIGGDPSWQDALSATAAHNCLTVDEKNCFGVLHGGGIRLHQIHVSAQRHEENGEVLIDARQEAYKESLGLIHHRSVYMNKTGTDLRVEDKLIGMGGSAFAISLHLHPDVHASLVQDGQAVLLKMNSGAGWHLRVQGAKLDIRESIYVPQPGQMRHTDQIIMQGPLRGEGVCVKWRLSKLGG